MAQQRRGVIRTATFEERLAEEAQKFREAAERQPRGSMARERAWDSLYPTPIPNAKGNPGWTYGSTMKPRYAEVAKHRGVGNTFRRIFLTGGAATVIRRLIPAYAGASVHLLEEGSLRGVAQLFQTNHG